MKANKKVTQVSEASQSPKWKLRAAISLALGLGLASQGVNALTSTWDGSFNNNWTADKNWLGNNAPLSSALTDLVFANAPGNRLTPVNVQNLTLNSILFDAANTNMSSYTIGTNSSTFTVGAGGVVNNDNIAQNLGAKFILSTSTTFNAASGDLNFTGAIDLNNATSDSSTKRLTLDGTNNITLSGVISDSSGTGALKKIGSGTTTLSGNNSYTGATNINAGTLALGANERLANTGTVNVNGGAFNVNGMTETIANLNLNNGAINGGGTLVVGKDYNNTDFGIGNAFNKSAGVTDTFINSSAFNAGSQQTLIAGTSTVTSGTGWILFGNVHVGDISTQTYTIGNGANSGSKLRGAVQDDGALDTRLSGTGIIAGGYNWGPVAAGGNAGEKNVTFTASTAGALDDTLTVVNNFSNTNTQNLVINGAAYRYASLNTLSPVTLANQRIGGSATQALSLTNSATNDGYSEKLKATIHASSPITASGSFNGLAAGSTNNNQLKVGVNTTSAGHKTGIATIGLVSNGKGTSDLGNTTLASQEVNVSGNVYRMATGLTAATVNLAAQHVGGSASQTLAVSNNTVNDDYSEKLDASFGNATGGISTIGVAGLIAAGSIDSSNMSVGIDTTTAGAKSGNVDVNFSSDGTGTSGLATISNGSQNVIVSGDVYNYAKVGLQHVSGGSTWDSTGLTLDFGTFTQGSGKQTSIFSLANSGLDSIYTDHLDGNYTFSLGTAFSSTNVSNFTNLAGGFSLTNLGFLFDTSIAGNYTGSVILASNGHNASGYSGALDGMIINFKGNVSAVPEPAAAWLFLTGMICLLGLGRHNKAI
ncbi:MAG: hypothetical protein RLZZ419_16 [Pseudomonadota bacterium]